MSTISANLSVYKTTGNIRGLIAKARIAKGSISNSIDTQVVVAASGSKTITVVTGNSLTIVLPAAPINIQVTNGSGTITFNNVDRLFVCPANVTALILINAGLVDVNVQVVQS